MAVRRALVWFLLIGLSALVGMGLAAFRVPAALLLGPMLVAVAFGVRGTTIRLPRPLFLTAQGLIGCLVASSVTAEFFAGVARDGVAMMLALVGTIAASTLTGWCLARWGRLPPAAVAWGASPGAASAMTAMAAEHGADARLVAFMQYVRVLCVVLTASFVAAALGGPAVGDAVPPPISDHASALSLAGTVAVAVGGSWLGGRLRVPAGGLLVPLAIGSALHATGLLELALPTALLGLGYGAIGLYIGLQFNRATLTVAAFALPEVVATSLATILLCGVSAWLLARLGVTDPLTAFLATTPGGIDTVAIIAHGGQADTAFVAALQTLRVLAVVLLGPAVARLIARTAGR